MSFRRPGAYEFDTISLVCAVLLLIIAIFLLIPAIDSSLKEIHNERNYQNEKI